MWKDVPYKNYAYSALALGIISILGVMIFRNILPPVVPLFYGRPVGQLQLVGSLGLVIAPGVSLIITLTNLFLVRLTENTFLKKILVISSFFISVLSLITVLKIINLVGFFN